MGNQWLEDTLRRMEELKKQLQHKGIATAIKKDTLTVGDANSGSATSQAPAAGGLFGQSTQTTQPSTGSSLFGSAAAATPKTGGLFGSATTTTSLQPQPTGGLFGTAATNPTQTQQTTGSSLFGAAKPAQQPTGGSLFGNAAAATTQPSQQTGSSLFGGTAKPAQTQQTGTSLFGNTTQTSQPAQGGGLFSTLNQPQNQPQNTSAMFGGSLFNKPQQPAQQKPSIFGQTAAQGNALGPGLPTLGQSLNQQTVPGVRIDVSNVRGTTRFNDLQEDLQKQIAEVDQTIQAYISQKNELDAFMPAHGDRLSSVPDDVKFVNRKYEGARNALEADAQAIEVVRSFVKQDADHARLSFRAIDNLKLPSQYHTSGLWPQRQSTGNTANTETDGQDLVGFFSKTADEMDEQLKRYEKNLSEIEMHMHGVSGSLVEQLQKAMASRAGGPTGVDEKLAELGGVLRDFEMGILKVASEVGSLREDLTKLQLGEFINNSEPRDGVY